MIGILSHKPIIPEMMHTVVLKWDFGLDFSLWLSWDLSNEKWRYMCNVFYYWSRPCWTIYRKRVGFDWDSCSMIMPPRLNCSSVLQIQTHLTNGWFTGNAQDINHYEKYRIKVTAMIFRDQYIKGQYSLVAILPITRSTVNWHDEFSILYT